MKKNIQKNGYVCIPKKIRDYLTSDTVEIELVFMNEQNVVVLKPVGKEKKPVTVYK